MPQPQRARRVIRSIDTWSVLKLSLLFYLSLLITVLVGGVILWQVAAAAGFTNNLAKLIRSLFDLTSYKFHGQVIFRNVAIGGAVLALFGSFLNALMCVLYNLISDVVGGISIVLVGEEAERSAPYAGTVATNGAVAGNKTAGPPRASRRERARVPATAVPAATAGAPIAAPAAAVSEIEPPAADDPAPVAPADLVEVPPAAAAVPEIVPPPAPTEPPPAHSESPVPAASPAPGASVPTAGVPTP